MVKEAFAEGFAEEIEKQARLNEGLASLLAMLLFGGGGYLADYYFNKGQFFTSLRSRLGFKDEPTGNPASESIEPQNTPKPVHPIRDARTPEFVDHKVNTILNRPFYNEQAGGVLNNSFNTPNVTDFSISDGLAGVGTFGAMGVALPGKAMEKIAPASKLTEKLKPFTVAANRVFGPLSGYSLGADKYTTEAYSDATGMEADTSKKLLGAVGLGAGMVAPVTAQAAHTFLARPEAKNVNMALDSEIGGRFNDVLLRQYKSLTQGLPNLEKGSRNYQLGLDRIKNNVNALSRANDNSGSFFGMRYDDNILSRMTRDGDSPATLSLVKRFNPDYKPLPEPHSWTKAITKPWDAAANALGSFGSGFARAWSNMPASAGVGAPGTYNK